MCVFNFRNTERGYNLNYSPTLIVPFTDNILIYSASQCHGVYYGFQNFLVENLTSTM